MYYRYTVVFFEMLEDKKEGGIRALCLCKGKEFPVSAWGGAAGFSLGLFVFVPTLDDARLRAHEYGHCLQSLALFSAPGGAI